MYHGYLVRMVYRSTGYKWSVLYRYQLTRAKYCSKLWLDNQDVWQQRQVWEMFQNSSSSCWQWKYKKQSLKSRLFGVHSVHVLIWYTLCRNIGSQGAQLFTWRDNYYSVSLIVLEGSQWLLNSCLWRHTDTKKKPWRLKISEWNVDRAM